jgi:hypothetical protein
MTFENLSGKILAVDEHGNLLQASAGLGSYYGLQPAYYEEFQPGTPWHQMAPGWSIAPVPGWGANPNLRGPKRVGVSGDSPSWGSPIGILAGLTLVAAFGYWLYINTRGYESNKPRRRRKRKLRSNRYRRNACRGRGGPYLMPGAKKYPAPTKRCARTALTYAGWPNNLDDAPAVLRGLKKTKWIKDPDVRDQARQLARVYREETGKSAPRV